jgi:hypothetical protein
MTSFTGIVRREAKPVKRKQRQKKENTNEQGWRVYLNNYWAPKFIIKRN